MQPWQIILLSALVAFVFNVGVEHPYDNQPVSSAQVPANCPVTLAPDLPFLAPPPNSPHAPWDGMFWYGSASLWTVLHDSGVWSGLPHNPEGYSQKVLFWRQGYLWTDEPEPALTVTGQRLDAPAPPLNVSRATNAFAEDIQSAMLVGVDFPALGCWEITGRYHDSSLSFVVWVAP
ncbi:MAG: hypothetical protein GC204_13865 [Chloroflexi bacterium]|nr:hypothetical protein [Chloroflexota bacterium]